MQWSESPCLVPHHSPSFHFDIIKGVVEIKPMDPIVILAPERIQVTQSRPSWFFNVVERRDCGCWERQWRSTLAVFICSLSHLCVSMWNICVCISIRECERPVQSTEYREDSYEKSKWVDGSDVVWCEDVTQTVRLAGQSRICGCMNVVRLPSRQCIPAKQTTTYYFYYLWYKGYGTISQIYFSAQNTQMYLLIFTIMKLSEAHIPASTGYYSIISRLLWCSLSKETLVAQKHPPVLWATGRSYDLGEFAVQVEDHTNASYRYRVSHPHHHLITGHPIYPWLI